MITCLIVDDEPIARRGLREYITREGDIKILAECENIIERHRDAIRIWHGLA